MIYEIELTTLTYGGEALGRLPDGRAVFVPFVLPGERARVELVEEKRGYARGRLVEVLRTAPTRIAPRCAHFTACGGCHYQHLSYADQLEAKSSILKDQLERIAGVINPPLRPIVPSPGPWYYRNAVQFHLDPQGRLGFLAADGSGVMAIRECHLPEEPLNDLWPRLDFEPLPGLERIALRLDARGEALVTLESSTAEVPAISVEELPVSVVFLSPEGPAVLAGEAFAMLEVLGRPFRVSAGSFFQVNTAMAAAMVTHLLETLPLQDGQTILDLYSGVGLFSAFLAPRAGRLIAVEAAPSACEDFAFNLDEFDNVELYQGEAGVVLPSLEVQPQIVIVDPPRAGLERPVLDALLRLRPAVLAYVSCDPATLARDCKRLLAGGYTLHQVTPFDLFPQTYHIESIVLMSGK